VGRSHVPGRSWRESRFDAGRRQRPLTKLPSDHFPDFGEKTRTCSRDDSVSVRRSAREHNGVDAAAHEAGRSHAVPAGTVAADNERASQRQNDSRRGARRWPRLRCSRPRGGTAATGVIPGRTVRSLPAGQDANWGCGDDSVVRRAPDGGTHHEDVLRRGRSFRDRLILLREPDHCGLAGNFSRT
jgi:hypothetical protein